ncbi:hypothetical protein [Bradyrhizobium sp. BWA-3-5]|uniref:hypothetical protein n=1 Tax=Bradyrhizobium sp. BWA-3-5 TaxID=3080013 RepID=UPI00293EA7E5|nr:hypothetical protein [Bradyrhizobium sp. BWA-3-5]WOH64067.1 hypothetical protein RX331_26085 [Bradyrhizobium sp. BWA-3-5]WOH64193.1 hypothetical protein RX331_26875 [Bradyrhizobium sp. BWA-3-5]WOH70116.1 hypothetical protein RX331_38020 [Bradyrhizobium sp. BWA-3-5]
MNSSIGGTLSFASGMLVGHHEARFVSFATLYTLTLREIQAPRTDSSEAPAEADVFDFGTLLAYSGSITNAPVR